MALAVPIFHLPHIFSPPTALPLISSPRPSLLCVPNLNKQHKRAEFEVLEEGHEAKHKEISARGRMALADFLLGTSDMTSPSSAAAGRVGGLPTVMEEGVSPTGAFCSRSTLSIYP